jgi:hypothetical protein
MRTKRRPRRSLRRLLKRPSNSQGKHAMRRGRFAASRNPSLRPTATDPPARTPVDDNAAMVPSWRVREINDEKRALADKVAALEAERQQWQRQQPPPKPVEAPKGSKSPTRSWTRMGMPNPFVTKSATKSSTNAGRQSSTRSPHLQGRVRRGLCGCTEANRSCSQGSYAAVA